MMLQTKQTGFAAWIALLILVSIAAASAVAGWFLLQEYDQQLQEQTSNNGSTEAKPSQQHGQLKSASEEASARSPKAASEASDDNDDSAPVTEIDLTLKGVITRSDPKNSRALITKGNEAEQAYQPGDAILSNVNLANIESDHVVLEVNGKRETLYLNRTLEGSNSSTHSAYDSAAILDRTTTTRFDSSARTDANAENEDNGEDEDWDSEATTVEDENVNSVDADEAWEAEDE